MGCERRVQPNLSEVFVGAFAVVAATTTGQDAIREVSEYKSMGEG